MNKQERKEYKKKWLEEHKEQYKVYQKAYMKAYYQAHKEQLKANMKAWSKAHRQESYKYQKSDVNSFGKTKNSIRNKSRIILKKSGIKIPGYEVHHCFGYNDPSKFIYCSRELHLKIHQFLRDNNIDADSDHYEQIKQLLDENVVTFGI